MAAATMHKIYKNSRRDQMHALLFAASVCGSSRPEMSWPGAMPPISGFYLLQDG